jgi:hypothetical protein
LRRGAHGEQREDGDQTAVSETLMHRRVRFFSDRTMLKARNFRAPPPGQVIRVPRRDLCALEEVAVDVADELEEGVDGGA